MPTARLSIILLFICTSAYGEPKSPFRPLFNGRNLDGWVRVNTAPSTWSVRDGMIICTGKPIGVLRTTRMYQNFIMEVEWRHMEPAGNAGIFLWADDITARGQPFHRGVEVQILENAYGNTRSYTTHGDIFPIHGATMTPINGRGGSRAFPVENRSRPSPQWNHYRITCNDGQIRLAVNGKTVTRGIDSNPRKGYICLESEGGIVHYRKLNIQELPTTPIKPDQIAIADRGYHSLYTGIDFSGWKIPHSKNKLWESRDWIIHFAGEETESRSILETEKSFGDFGFIFDVRITKQTKPCEIFLRGSNQAVITLGPAIHTKFLNTQHLQWNRFEGSLRNHTLNVSINGNPVLANQALTDLPDHGPLKIKPTGTIEFANLFVKPL